MYFFHIILQEVHTGKNKADKIIPSVIFLLSIYCFLPAIIKKRRYKYMKCIIKYEIRFYLKNPIFYIGILLVFFGVYQNMAPYLGIRYFQSGEEISVLENMERGDGDIMHGFIPTTREEQMEIGFANIQKDLQEQFDMSAEEVTKIIDYLKSSEFGIAEIDYYLKENCSFYSGDYYFWNAEKKQVSAAEVNGYMESRMEEETYTGYFSRKYVDYLGVYILFFVIVLFAFLFYRDMKKDIYELLHTKPISSFQYITGKVIGGFASAMIVVVILTVLFDILSVSHGIKAGFPTSALDIWKPVLLYVVPNIFMVSCFYAGVSLVFQNPLPAVPALMLYMVYSNMGSVNEEGKFGYYGRLFAILVRFPESFFQSKLPEMALLNQVFLMILAVLLLAVSVLIWKRRRVC